MRNAAITGWGMAVPERVLTNADLERMVETSDEWITSRTGIKERRIVGPEDSTTSLSVTAARQALDTAGLTADEIASTLKISRATVKRDWVTAKLWLHNRLCD